VKASTEKKNHTSQPLGSSVIRMKSSGDTSRRTTVMKLAGVASASGP
jgi:hypothetical protein